MYGRGRGLSQLIIDPGRRVTVNTRFGAYHLLFTLFSIKYASPPLFWLRVWPAHTSMCTAQLRNTRACFVKTYTYGHVEIAPVIYYALVAVVIILVINAALRVRFKTIQTHTRNTTFVLRFTIIFSTQTVHACFCFSPHRRRGRAKSNTRVTVV